MYAQRVNGTVYVTLSGRLDVSKALDVLCFLDLYVNRGQGIVMDTSNLSPDNSRGLEMLRKGLQRLEALGHPILDHQFETLIWPDKQA
jgi:anti-anti-sigma regulatory factor